MILFLSTMKKTINGSLAYCRLCSQNPPIFFFNSWAKQKDSNVSHNIFTDKNSNVSHFTGILFLSTTKKNWLVLYVQAIQKKKIHSLAKQKEFPTTLQEKVVRWATFYLFNFCRNLSLFLGGGVFTLFVDCKKNQFT